MLVLIERVFAFLQNYIYVLYIQPSWYKQRLLKENFMYIFASKHVQLPKS